MDSPRVSVVMSVFNGEQYLKPAMESILDQTYDQFEFIIVDNRSTDETINIIQGFDDPRIKLIVNAVNLGQSGALNVGIRSSRGEFIARMDADDISLRTRLETQVAFLDANPEVSVVGSWATFIDREGKKIEDFYAPTETNEVTLFMSGSPELSFGCNLHPALMLRRECFDEIGLYDETNSKKRGYPQDYELWSKMIYAGKNFANIDQKLFHYRVLKQSESHYDLYQFAQYKIGITLEKLDMYMPELGYEQRIDLARMLEFWPVHSSARGKTVLDLFDQYLQIYAARSGITEGIEDVKDRMTLYYLPKLAKTNLLLSLKLFFQLLIKHPGYIRDRKFYRKLIKSFLGHKAPECSASEQVA